MERFHPVTNFSEDRTMVKSKNWNTFATLCSTIINMSKLLPIKSFFLIMQNILAFRTIRKIRLLNSISCLRKVFKLKHPQENSLQLLLQYKFLKKGILPSP
uniref:Uncharacterized protein n=1 Tax=Micrurus lemniscatus lemniscatus TaxID=129467 RepID=A0A2D4I7G9_MICLE